MDFFIRIISKCGISFPLNKKQKIDEHSLKMQEHQELKSDLKVLRKQMSSIEKEYNYKYSMYMADSKYIELNKQFDDFTRRLSSLKAYIIRINLNNFGIEDMQVTAVKYFRRDEKIEPNGHRYIPDGVAATGDMLLSELCALCSSSSDALLMHFGLDVKLEYCFSTDVEVAGKKIGYVDYDGTFNYTSSPDLYTALAWGILSDRNCDFEVESLDLVGATTSILDLINSKGVSKEIFFDNYMPLLRDIYVGIFTPINCELFHGLVIPYWIVSTTELGNEHEGYSFCC